LVQAFATQLLRLPAEHAKLQSNHHGQARSQQPTIQPMLGQTQQRLQWTKHRSKDLGENRRKKMMSSKYAKLAPVKTIKIEVIDYKDVATLRKFISDRGKIRARRITGATVQDQRKIAKAIKNAREMALLPYAGAGR
jgi:small subunit ribosomal protein S18